MTQRIFDTQNEKDMRDLWDIIPESIIKIRKGYKSEDKYYYNYYDTSYMEAFYESAFLLIDWHDKTEITRPMQEATEADIGKLCMFWDSKDGIRTYGILQSIGSAAYRLQNTYPYSECYHHCRRLTKQEIEELC